MCGCLGRSVGAATKFSMGRRGQSENILVNLHPSFERRGRGLELESLSSQKDTSTIAIKLKLSL